MHPFDADELRAKKPDERDSRHEKIPTIAWLQNADSAGYSSIAEGAFERMALSRCNGAFDPAPLHGSTRLRA
jgi:hypothetical protein